MPWPSSRGPSSRTPHLSAGGGAECIDRMDEGEEDDDLCDSPEGGCRSRSVRREGDGKGTSGSGGVGGGGVGPAKAWAAVASAASVTLWGHDSAPGRCSVCVLQSNGAPRGCMGPVQCGRVWTGAVGEGVVRSASHLN